MTLHPGAGPGLPDGFTVRVRDDIRRADAGRIMIGGAPLRALRLLPPAAAALDSDGVVTVRDQASRLVADRLLEADLAIPVLPAGLGADPGDLTVVIPIRDRASELNRLLSRLRPSVRCVVVDDASHEPAAITEVAARHGADLVVLEQNRGPAGARNAGLAEVTTPLVAFVDSDITAQPEVLLRLALHFADPRVALVAPLVKGKSPSPTPRWFERYDEIASSLDLGLKPSAVRPGGGVAWLPSACLVARTPVMRDLGGFDAAMRVAEDVDLVWRLVDHAWRVRYDPDLSVEHQTLTSLASWVSRKFDYGTGGAALADRHGNLVAPAVLSPLFGAAALALLAQRRWSPLVIAVAFAHAAWTLHRKLPPAPDNPRLALRLAAEGLGWMARQESALLLRHWWPVTALGTLFSRRMRRAALVAVIADTFLAYRSYRSEIGPIAFAAARRLDDLGYGAGLWVGARRHRSWKVLLPRRS